MSVLSLPLACMSAILYNIVIVQASSLAYHRIQVGGPANQITTGEIRIDLPSESFQNVKFNITPYSLQNEYSPYYDQYRAGYQPSAYSPPKTQTNKQSSQSAYKSPPQVSYKPPPVVSYKPSPSVPHPVYSFPQATYNQPTYTQPKVSYNQQTYTQPQVSYNQPSYTQPQVSYNQPTYKQPTVSYNQQYSQPTYKQPQVSYNRPSYSPIQAVQPSYQPQDPVYSYKPVTQKITSVVDLKETEAITEAAPVEEASEDERSGKTVTENDSGNSDTSENLYTKVFKQFKSYNLDVEARSDSETESDSEAEEARKAKNLDTVIEDFDQNSVDSVASSTLLPEFIPIMFEEAGISTKDNSLLTTEKSVESTTLLTSSLATTIAPTTTDRLTTTTTPTAPTTPRTITTTASTTTTTLSSIRRRPVISFFNDLTTSTSIAPTSTARLTTTTTTTAPTTTTSITTKRSTTTTTASSIRRRPVISFFQDLTSSTSPPPIQSITPPGEIGQSILDKMRTATLTVQRLLDSEEEITLKPTEDKSNAVKSKDEDTDGELLESEIYENGDEEKSRERRKIVKVRKSKNNGPNQGSNFASHWQNGRWF